MFTPDDLERQHTLLGAAHRYDELRTRDALAPPAGAQPEVGDSASLGREDALEMLALGEVLARKAGYGRQLAVRTARAAGASWSQIGAALGTTKQSAWEAHERWIDDQARQHQESDYQGLDPHAVALARDLAGSGDEP